MVAEVVRRLRDPVLSSMSIGVVTFSLPQQNLIEDLLSAEFAADPALDELNSRSAEPVFVKNLENVQGDERDVILFSVCYGPDKTGQVTLNFGPLNRDGGWRRLNVAVSRARCEMMVFSVLRPEHLDPGRIHAEGVLALRAFLEFAMRGSEALLPERRQPDAVTAAVAEAIKGLGYQVRTGIGASAFRIDIGVIHPEKPDTYLLGILLDNASITRSTARDRDIVQEGVLASLGWHILHVWTLDWWENPGGELDRIRAELDRLLTEPEPPESLPGPVAAVPEAAGTAAAPGCETVPGPAEEPSAAGTTRLAAYPPETAAPGAAAHAPIPAAAASASASAAAPEVYRPVQLQTVPRGYGDPQSFVLPQNDAMIRRQILSVMEAEAPIERLQLRRRVLDAWGISRAGARIEQHFDDLLARMQVPVTFAGDRVFCWKPGQDSETWSRFRVPDSYRRAMDDIPPQEIAAAAGDIMRRQLGMSLADLQRSVAGVFGYARVSSLPAISEGIRIAHERGWLTLDGERVSVGPDVR